MRRALVSLLLLALVLAATSATPYARAEAERPPAENVSVHLFWSETCPHCTRAKSFLETLSARSTGVDLQSHELSTDEAIIRAFLALSGRFGVEPPAVPLIIVGNRPIVGYGEATTTGAEIEATVAACRKVACPDVVAPLLAAGDVAPPTMPREKARPSSLPRTIQVPLIGEVDTEALSLPALTALLAAIDGFNPCAMWVLVFLIGLLVGMQDQVRMWSYGAIFLATSAAVYFAFLAAWLNLFLLVGSLPWIRAGIGLFAVGAGGFYLYQFFANPEAACPVTTPGERQRVMTRLKEVVAERSFIVAAIGLVALAVLVNLIELLCSAGIPAVYTQVLALSDLTRAEYYLYLSLYVAVFLLDDMVVFVTAMVTLRSAGLAGTYARYSHLIGGIVMGTIGVLLLFRPDWLTFA